MSTKDCPEELKLQRLRAKTDRELAILLRNKLDRGMAFARLAAEEETRDRWSTTEEFVGAAEYAIVEAAEILSMVRGEDHLRLEMKLAELRRMLDKRTGRSLHAHAACS